MIVISRFFQVSVMGITPLICFFNILVISYADQNLGAKYEEKKSENQELSQENRP